MTENELKKIIAIYKKTLEVIADNGETCFQELDKNTLLFLEELEVYRAIGTIEEFKRAKEMEAVYGQVKWERDVAISQLEEIGVSLGQKMDEFKALKEKNETLKALYKDARKEGNNLLARERNNAIDELLERQLETLEDFKEWEDSYGYPIHSMSETQRISKCKELIKQVAEQLKAGGKNEID